MNLKEAIAGSVEKWRALLDGEAALDTALHWCSLCRFYGADQALCDCCKPCLLYLSGNGCLELDSPFVVIHDAYEDDDTRTINHPSIRPHAEAMYAALLDIQRQHE